MDFKKAKEIVSALAEGIDPITGEIFPSEHVCNQADVIRALYTVLNTLEPAKSKKQAENAGKPWLPEADAELIQLYKEGTSISELSKHFGRSVISIEARLEKLGIIQPTKQM